MSVPAAVAGEVHVLTRRLSAAPHPLVLLHTLTDGGERPDTLLLEQADAASGGRRSLIVARSMGRVACRDDGGIEREALTPNGRSLFDAMGPMTLAPPRAESEELDDRARLTAPGPLDPLRRLLALMKAPGSARPGGPLLAGLFSYDLVDRIERLPAGRPGLAGVPLYLFWIPDRLILIDHAAGATTVAALAVGGDSFEKEYHDAEREIARLGRMVETLAGEQPAPPAPAPDGPVGVDLPDPEFADLVRRLQRHIVAGDVFQIVPSRTFTTPCADPFGAFRRMWDAECSAWRYWIRAPGFVLFGASPETALRVHGPSRRLVVRPIAGTFPRGQGGDGGTEQDARLQAALLTDPKELAEHLMLVDLARNDVARVSRPGTRRVERLLTVERHARVMHIVSEVAGELDAGLDALHAYAATLNMGTLVGAPKIKAASLLREHETTRRGAYGGAAGWLSADGSMDTAIVIRSAVVAGGLAHVRAGAGVVLDSDPRSEALETRRKAAALMASLTQEAVA